MQVEKDGGRRASSQALYQRFLFKELLGHLSSDHDLEGPQDAGTNDGKYFTAVLKNGPGEEHPL